MRRNLIASILSVIPGLGQMYLGYWRRGAALFFGLPALAFPLWALGLPGLIFLIFLAWIWGIFDAYMLAEKNEISIVFPVTVTLLAALITSWQITEIDFSGILTKIGKSGGIIISQLVRPDLRAEQRTETLTASGKLIVYDTENPPSLKPEAPSEEPALTFEPAAVKPNQEVEVRLANFPKNETVVIYRQGADLVFLELRTDESGSAQTSIINPVQQPGEFHFDARIVRSVTTWQPSETLRLSSAAVLQTVFMALLGTFLSIVLAIPLSFLAARNLMKGSCLGWTAYSTTRLGFNVIRSFEVLVIAVVLVGILGPGPFAGVLALAIHGIGATGKLYSEAIESIDHGPIEAITATGANRLQVIIFGVIPQIVPQFVSFTLYRWDINVRMATVIGLVGGGGIGQLLYQYIGLTQWTRAATAIWMIAAVVMLMDYLSAVIREKLV